MSIINVHNVLSQSVDRTKSLVADLEKCQLTLVTSITITNEEIFDELGRQKIVSTLNYLDKHIYLLRVVEEKSEQIVKDAFKVFKKNSLLLEVHARKHLSRFNSKSETVNLYVGSSKDIKGRIKQHLGDGDHRTYSLHLRHWFPKDVDLILEVYYPSCQYQNVVETLEQAIWDEAKPLFGKRTSQ